jgi:hypothetical protein
MRVLLDIPTAAVCQDVKRLAMVKRLLMLW